MLKPMETNEQIIAIKRACRGLMNGPVSASMREKGLTYKVNFGVELPRLRELADTLPHNYDLAASLWKENIRECRLLAGMLMPTDAFDAELADLWVEQIQFEEEAECTTAHLFSRLPYASAKAFEWVAREERLFRLCGWLLFSALFKNGMTPAPRDARELMDQARSELSAVADRRVAAAAQRAVMHFMALGAEQEQMGDAMLTACGL